MRRVRPGTQTPAPADAPAPPALPLPPLTLLRRHSGRGCHTRLALRIYLTAKYSCFSLFILTGCKFASGWQLQAGTAWEEPQGQLQAYFCQATEGCPVPWAGRGSGGAPDQTPDHGKPLPGTDAGNPPPNPYTELSFLLAVPEAGASLRRHPFGISGALLAATPGTQTLRPLQPRCCR